MTDTRRQSLYLRCPAKVNLALSIGPPRSDGYHPIASWMVALDFADNLTLEPTGDGQSRFDIAFDDDAPHRQPTDWPLEQDLAYRAHQALESHVDRALPIHASIRKHIPAGAGLGGGSSDAAAMLVALNRLFDLSLSTDALMELGLRLGADVPFLVAALDGMTSAVAEGLGQQLQPAPLPEPIALALVLPPFGCPTGPVYRAFDERADGAELAPERVRSLANRRPVRTEALFNDLAEPAMRIQPRLRELHREVGQLTGQPVHVTGSGAALFLPCPSIDEARSLATRVAQGTAVPAVAARTLPYGPG